MTSRSTLKIQRPAAVALTVTCRHEPTDNLLVEPMQDDNDKPYLFVQAESKNGLVSVSIDPATSIAVVRELALMLDFDIVPRTEPE
ncbi:MAG: hypothetical protein ACXW13_00015 [Burkholderiaceae bacterium]